MAVLHGGTPKSANTDLAVETLKLQIAEMQSRQANNATCIRFLQMLSPGERKEALSQLKILILPGSQNT